MIGVVLCGGQSTRMGQDKGLLQHQSATWAQVAAEKLQQLHLPIVLSVNQQQLQTYQQLFQNLMLVADDATLTIGGPLKGLLSVHIQYPQEDLLILACDMRDMHQDVLKHLVATASGTDAEAVVFCDGDAVEPLCGFYSAGGLQKVYNQYRHGLLKKFSMQAVLQLLQAIYLPIPQAWQASFKNFNAPTDLIV